MKSIRFFSPIFAAVLLSMASAACSPKSGITTKVVGQFAENAPETVRFTKGYIDGLSENEGYVALFDTTVAVVNGRFEVEIPIDVTTQTEFRFGNDTEFPFGSNMVTPRTRRGRNPSMWISATDGTTIRTG